MAAEAGLGSAADRAVALRRLNDLYGRAVKAQDLDLALAVQKEIDRMGRLDRVPGGAEERLMFGGDE